MQPLALAGVLATASLQQAFAPVAACAALAGAFASPITTLTRTLWRHRFEGEDDRRTAFALDAVTIELNFTVGPALIAVVLATFGATAAFALAIAAVIAAAAIYLASGVLGYFRRAAAAGPRHLLGPLTEPRLWLVFVAMFGVCATFGLLEVGYPAYATAMGAPAMAGLLLAINSIGSAVGGAIFGGMHLRAPMERQFGVAIGLMAVPYLLHALLQQPLAFGVVAFLAGALIAPTITAQSVLVSRLAPAHYATEAFTWSSTFIVSGLGAGMALGGALAEHAGLRTAFASAAAIVAAMSIFILALLTPAPGAVARAGD